MKMLEKTLKLIREKLDETMESDIYHLDQIDKNKTQLDFLSMILDVLNEELEEVKSEFNPLDPGYPINNYPGSTNIKIGAAKGQYAENFIVEVNVDRPQWKKKDHYSANIQDFLIYGHDLIVKFSLSNLKTNEK